MMTRRQFYVALAVLAVSGLMGALLSGWLLQGGAERTAPTATYQTPERTAPPQYYAPPRTQAGTVYVAPHSGQRWHVTPDCRGLRNALRVEELPLERAQGYTPCKICAGG